MSFRVNTTTPIGDTDPDQVDDVDSSGGQNFSLDESSRPGI